MAEDEGIDEDDEQDHREDDEPNHEFAGTKGLSQKEFHSVTLPQSAWAALMRGSRTP
jgi:hypothetical protein